MMADLDAGAAAYRLRCLTIPLSRTAIACAVLLSHFAYSCDAASCFGTLHMINVDQVYNRKVPHQLEDQV